MIVTVVLRNRNIGSVGLPEAAGRDVMVNISSGSPAIPSTEIVMAMSTPTAGSISKMSDVTIEKSLAAQQETQSYKTSNAKHSN